jgi:hypothetical protein
MDGPNQTSVHTLNASSSSRQTMHRTARIHKTKQDGLLVHTSSTHTYTQLLSSLLPYSHEHSKKPLRNNNDNSETSGSCGKDQLGRKGTAYHAQELDDSNNANADIADQETACHWHWRLVCSFPQWRRLEEQQQQGRFARNGFHRFPVVVFLRVVFVIIIIVVLVNSCWWRCVPYASLFSIRRGQANATAI